MNAQYLSDKVDVDQVFEDIAKKPKFQAFKAYIQECSGGALDVEPYLTEGMSDDKKIHKVASFDVGIKVFAQTGEGFKDGLKALKSWDQSKMRDNFRPVMLDEHKEFSLFD